MEYTKERYINDPNFTLLHIKGFNASDSVSSYLHYTRRYLLIYFKRGSGTIKIEGRNYVVREGDIILLNNTELFRLYVDDQTFHERLSISLGDALFSKYPDSAATLLAPFLNRPKGFKNKISTETANEYGLHKNLLDILGFLQSNEPEAPLLAFCELCRFLVSLSKAVKTSPALPQTVSNPLIIDVLDYLNLHYTEDITITDLSTHFSIDKSHLSHLFKEYVGMSVLTYVITRRIQHFNQIISTGLSIEEAAFKSGFRNYSNFFRLYKKYMKTTPTEFKKQLFSKEKSTNNEAFDYLL